LASSGSFAAAGTQAAYKLDLPKSRFYGDDTPAEQQQQLRQSSSNVQSLLRAAPDKQQLAKSLQQVTEVGVSQSGSPSPDSWQQQQQQAANALQPPGSSGSWVIAAGTASGSSSPSWVQLEGSVDSNGARLSSGRYSAIDCKQLACMSVQKVKQQPTSHDMSCSCSDLLAQHLCSA
jgi:hypothetical protein